MMKKSVTLAMTVCIMAGWLPVANAKTVYSLADVEKSIKSREINRYYQQQMNGVASDGFSALSHQDTTIPQMLNVIGHPNNTKKLALLGVKHWYDDYHIVVACSYQQEVNWSHRKTAYAECSHHFGTVATITLAIVRKKQQQWQLVAHPYQEQLDDFTEQQFVNSAFLTAGIVEEYALGDLDRLDIANYQLNQHTKAFGLRLNTSAGFAGGGQSRQNMTLFAILNGKLKPVLNVPTYSFSDIAGSWNVDGTRQHDIEQSEYILIITKQKTNGFYDILWKEKNKKQTENKRYRWDKWQQKYVEIQSVKK